MKIPKELQLDAEALFSQAVYGHGFLHYGYWPDGRADELTLQALGRAQQAYFDKLVETIPEGTRSILDVGSGTGSNALGLTRRNLHVDCVCPSPKLNAIARSKLPASSQIFECIFENLQAPGRYDMAMFCESFHYIDAERALEQVARYATRHLLIFDYFPRRDGTGRARVSHQQFLQLVTRQGVFETVSDVDLTAGIVPTFEVLDSIRNLYVRPFVSRMVDDFRRDHRLLALLLAWPLRRAQQKMQRPSNRHQTFAVDSEYRLMLLARR